MKSILILVIICVCSFARAQDYSLDRKLGKENSKLMEQEMGIYRHDSLHWLVNSVGQKLVSRLKNKPFEFYFFLADSEEPNAFALPGGYVYVTRGILPLLQTEDELAGIMAHEIIHVMQRHSVKQMQKSTLTGLLKIPGNLINALTRTRLGNVLNTPIDLATGSYIAKYSRGHEAEADKYGIQLAASAGYKTDALADALQRLSKKIELLTGQAEQRNYFSNHPFTPSRVSAIKKLAGMYKPVASVSITSSREQFIRTFDGLVFGPNPAQGVFIDSLFIHPDMGFTFIVPSAWNKLNKPSMAGAHQEKGEAMVTLRVSDNSKSPEQNGKEIVEKAEKQEGLTVLAARDTIINGVNGYIVKLKSERKSETAILELVWLTYQNTIYQLTGLSVPTHTHSVHTSLCSFKPVTISEKQLVKQYTLRNVHALENETIGELSKRTNNRLLPELTALINTYTVEEKLQANSLVKIVTAQVYRGGN